MGTNLRLGVERDEVPVLDEDEEAVDALGELSDASSKRGLVLSGERLVGLLSISDPARARGKGPRRRRRAPEELRRRGVPSGR